VTVTGTKTTATAAGSALVVPLGAKATGEAITIEVSNIFYATTKSSGPIVVTPTVENVTFSPATTSNATVVATPVAAPSISLVASGMPHLTAGESDGLAGTWTLELKGNSTDDDGWGSGATVSITVAPPSGTNCQATDHLYFTGLPTVSVSSTGVSTAPTVSDALANTGTCTSGESDQLRVSFTNSGTFDATSTGVVTIAISGVAYTLGTTSAALGSGTVAVQVGYSAGGPTISDAQAANAMIGGLSVSADTPPVTVSPSAYDIGISAVVMSAAAPVTIPAGYVCLSLTGGSFDSAASPKVTVTSGDPTVSSTVTFQGTGATGAAHAVADVTGGSSSGAAISISGLMVDAPSTSGRVVVTATYGPSASCTRDTTVLGSAAAFTVARATVVTQIYGPTADATAAAELEHQFDPAQTACPGRSGARPVVLATDANYPDALSSAYLASDLQTGELLTPTASLSAATAEAIREEGITNVYVVGGPLAVSAAVVSQLEATLAYNCGGANPITAAHPVYLQVTRISGQTEYDTAEWIAEYPSATNVGTLDVAGAFSTTNRTGGTGRYNDTTGTGSSAPPTASAVPTAILATGRSFQDAESASVLAYADRLPILLTTPLSLSPEVASAISTLQIKQVIVMGGPLAVSDAVVTSLEALGVSVLRVAGHTDTDTAVQLADFEMGASAGHLGLGWTGTGGVTVARGNFYTDGLAGAVVAAGQSRTHTGRPEPLLLTNDPTTVGPYLTAFLERAGTSGIDGDASETVTTLTVLGGPDAVAPTAVQSMRADL
jgi:putative cell wall-binding protein